MMERKELYKLIPFGIASALFLTDLIRTLTMPGYTNADGIPVTYVLSDSVRNGGFGLAIVLTLILVKKTVWKYVFAILTVFALTPVISFFRSTISVGSGKIEIELTALAILVLHLALNPEVFASFKTVLKSAKQSDESKQKQFETSVQRFENKFDGKSQAELQRMVSQNALVPEAIEAAKRLLERDKSATTQS